MVVYLAFGRRTEVTVQQAEGMPLWYVTVGQGLLARRRCVRLLRDLWDRGARRYICREAPLAALAETAGLTPYPVLPLRLALLEKLLAVQCPAGAAEGAAVLRCGSGGEEIAGGALPVLAAWARCVRLDMERPEMLAGELLYRWGVAAGDGGRPVAVTVVCGAVQELPAGPVVYLTEDCAARQRLEWTAPGAEKLPVPATEALAAALVEAGRWRAADIRVLGCDAETEKPPQGRPCGGEGRRGAQPLAWREK